MGVSFELDVTVPDSPTGSPVMKATASSNGVSKGKDIPAGADGLGSGGETGIKPAGEPGSFFEAGNEYLPPHLRDGATVKKEGSQHEVIDLKKEGSPPRLVMPSSSPPWFGSQPQSQSQRDENGAKGVKGKRKGRGRRRSSSPFEVPAGSQIIDLLSEGEEGSVELGTPVASRSQSQKRGGTDGGSQGQKSSSQQSGKGKTGGSQKKAAGSQKGGLPKGPGLVKKGRKGAKGEVAI